MSPEEIDYSMVQTIKLVRPLPNGNFEVKVNNATEAYHLNTQTIVHLLWRGSKLVSDCAHTPRTSMA